MLSPASRRACRLDPGYHRYRTFGRVDRVRAAALHRPLLYHEQQARWPWPQQEIAARVERAIAAREGEVLVIRCSRQTGKNEVEAQLESRALSIWRGVPGSIWVRTAPTWRPQIVNSKVRLEKHLMADPLLDGRWQSREGFIYESGCAQVHFLSADRRSSVVGATASVCLSVDEAHRTDRGKFDDELAPFTASTNAPTTLWGVAAGKQDLLYEYRSKLDGTDCVLEYPADVWCELSKSYAAHYESRVRLLGKDHATIKTQYDLLDIEAMGTFLGPAQRAALFSGDHPRLQAPRTGMQYAIVVDIGGESENELSSAEVREDEPGRDSTMVWVLEWDPSKPGEPHIRVRIVDGHWWTGKQHEKAGPLLVTLAKHWGVVGGVIDAVGIGEATAGYVERRVPCVQGYKASGPTISDDCFDLQARLNTGSLAMWRSDPAADVEQRELQAQALYTHYQIRGHTKMRLVKPTGRGSTGMHIDGIKALTYLHRAVGQEYGGLMAFTGAGGRKSDKAEPETQPGDLPPGAEVS